jgi:DeoR/GlpR family transcriptional regulator of sugar metabolism
MFTQERHRALLALLEQRRRASNDELVRALRTSPATLRRDLAELEAAGAIVRFHGGAAHPAYLHGEPTFEQRSREAMAEKRAMAAAVAELIPAQQTVFLDAGTSCLEVGRALMTRSDLVLIANSIAFAHAARDAAAKVIVVGGELRGVTSALVGGLAQAWLEQLRADVAVIGASGLDDDGPSTTELGESAVKQALVRRASRRILVADGAKWGHPAAVRFAAWADFETWVTAGDVPREAIQRSSARGVQVVRARGTDGVSRTTKERS